MNDEIQVTNRELLIACYAEICGVLDDASVRYDGHCGSHGAWYVKVYASQNPDMLDWDKEVTSWGFDRAWDFDQTRNDPHMQRALVDVRRFVSEGLATARHTRKEFDYTYAQLKEAFGDNLQKFLQLAQEKFDDENYEASSWSSSSDNCW